MLICIDPGHVRNYNRGAYLPYYEGTKMYTLGLMLKEELEKYKGISVFLTRSSVDDDPSLYERGMMAKSKGAHLFLSIHSDACGTESINRVSVFRSIHAPDSAVLGDKLMNTAVSCIGEDIPIQRNPSGVLTRDYVDNNTGVRADYYGVIRNSIGGTVKDSLIIEHGFHTNYMNSEWLFNEDNLRKLAIAEAKTIATHYGYTSVTSTTTTDTSSSTTSQETATTSTYINYTVVRGDSWWSIAHKKMGSGLKMGKLAKFNNRTLVSMLRVGEIIKIPSSGDTSELDYTLYTVVRGDSWWSIAQKKLGDGGKYNYLATYNGKSSTEMLMVGQILKIPKL